MSAVKKLKWKRSLSKLRFSYEELEYVEEVSAEAALEFEKHYRKFCALNNVDIPTLEKKIKKGWKTILSKNRYLIKTK